MKAQKIESRLLELYDQVADAPDAVERLRKFVLDLAVRGKLVEQDPGDEPTLELLKRIAAESARLVKQGKIRKPKVTERIGKREWPFNVPRNWEWVRIGEIGVVGSSSRVHQKDWTNQGVPFYRAREIVKLARDGVVDNELFISEELYAKLSGNGLCPEPNDLMITGVGTIGVSYAVAHGDRFYFKDASVLILKNIFNLPVTYIRLFCSSPYWFETIHKSSMGTTVHTLTISRANEVLVPLPPLAEQHRIAAKVEELMALLDRLEIARTQRETTRDRLTTASLTRLTAPKTTAEDFPTHARFALDNLNQLTGRPDQVKTLRQTILNLAVRGKLVAQDPAEEALPCFDRDIPEELERPFPIPPSWQWSRLRALGTIRGGGTPSKVRDDFWNGSIPWVSPKDMKVDYIGAAQLSITESAVSDSAVNLIEPESILFVVRGMILAHSFPVAVSRVPLTINQDMKAVTLKKPDIAGYVLRAVKGLTPEMLTRVQRSSHGTCRIEGSDYGDFLIPIPPLLEQHRIVAKMDTLMTLCDRLESVLATADTVSTRLLETLLRKVLSPISRLWEHQRQYRSDVAAAQARCAKAST